MQAYSFFDYKYNIEGFDSDLFSPMHIVYIIVVYVLGFAFSFLFRNTKRESISRGLKALSLIMPILEISKITWESYFDITTGQGFNYGGILPLYTCSLFMYALIGAAWGRGRLREYCLSFITTIGLLYGAVGVVYCNGLNYYPFWTFGAFYSLFFHSAMFITGVFLLVSGYKRLEWADCLRAMIPILALAAIAVPFNYVYNHLAHSNADYMLLYSGGGVPIYQDLSEKLAQKGLRFVYTIIMLLTHITLAALVTGAYKLINSASARNKKSKSAIKS